MCMLLVISTRRGHPAHPLQQPPPPATLMYVMVWKSILQHGTTIICTSGSSRQEVPTAVAISYAGARSHRRARRPQQAGAEHKANFNCANKYEVAFVSILQLYEYIVYERYEQSGVAYSSTAHIFSCAKRQHLFLCISCTISRWKLSRDIFGSRALTICICSSTISHAVV